MNSPLLAAGWNDLFTLLPFIIAVLVWAINRFAGTVQKPPQKPVQGKPPAQPMAKPGNNPLQSEIDDFLRQAKSLRENKPGQARGAAAQGGIGQRDQPPPIPQPGQSPRQRQQRPTFLVPGKRTARREQTRPPSRPVAPPAIAESAESKPVRESVAEHVAQAMDTARFDRRDAPLNQSQQNSDAEFRQHMDRVFQRDIGTLKPEATGIFKEAAATAAAATAVLTAQAVASAAGSESATAPVTIRKVASDISLFLAGRKNIRDAIILSEIIKRPEDRW